MLSEVKIKEIVDYNKLVEKKDIDKVLINSISILAMVKANKDGCKHKEVHSGATTGECYGYHHGNTAEIHSCLRTNKLKKNDLANELSKSKINEYKQFIKKLQTEGTFKMFIGMFITVSNHQSNNYFITKNILFEGLFQQYISRTYALNNESANATMDLNSLKYCVIMVYNEALTMQGELSIKAYVPTSKCIEYIKTMNLQTVTQLIHAITLILRIH